MELSLAEILLIVVVSVVFIGPKDLPVIIRAAAKGLKAVRSVYSEIKKGFDDLARETGLKETTDAIHTEMRLIKGDDGNLYESYDLTKLPPAKRGE